MVTAHNEGAQASLMAAGLELFAARGVATVVLDEVRRAAGASTGSVYHHFPGGKKDLAGTVWLDALEVYHAALVGELERHRAARAGIVGVVRRHMDFLKEEPERAGILAYEPAASAGADAGEVHKRNQALAGALGAWLEHHADAGAVRRLPIGVALAVWLGPAFVYGREADLARIPPVRIVRLLGEAAWAGLRG